MVIQYYIPSSDCMVNHSTALASFRISLMLYRLVFQSSSQHETEYFLLYLV